MVALLKATHLPIPADALCWRRPFAGRPEQSRSVREFVAFLLADSPHADDAVHAAAEFFCNAIQYTHSGTPGGLVTVEIRRWGSESCAVLLTDQGGPGEPRSEQVEDGGLLQEHGWGLRTVTATTSFRGWWGDDRSRTVAAIFTG
jgi:serine/threonine-protein kinase RsbW